MATLTITTTAAQDARLAKAFGVELQLGGNANAAQIRGAVLEYIKAVVRKQELAEATRAANEVISSITPIDVT